MVNMNPFCSLHFLHFSRYNIRKEKGGIVVLDASLAGESQTFVAPSADDARIIQESSRKLDEILSASDAEIHVRIQPENEPEQTIPIPLSAFRVLAHVLTQMAHGNGVSFMPMNAELTTYEAARVLKISHPFLLGLLEKGEVPFREVETRRRIRYQDLMAYKQKTDQNRIKSLEQLSALDQELGLD
jgi:excisionase family DNA binding protein